MPSLLSPSWATAEAAAATEWAGVHTFNSMYRFFFFKLFECSEDQREKEKQISECSA